MSNSFPQRAVSIDVHHHFNPTFKDNESNPWPVQMALDELDRNGIASAIAWLGPVNGSNSDERRGQARDWNEWGTWICLQHPGRFGLFATLPLLDTDLALSESRTPMTSYMRTASAFLPVTAASGLAISAVLRSLPNLAAATVIFVQP
jgi:hypothetical protein